MFAKVLDSDIASEIGREVISHGVVLTCADGGFVRDSALGKCHTAEVVPFCHNIIVAQCHKATMLAGQGMFDGELLITPIASWRQVLGGETHAKV